MNVGFEFVAWSRITMGVGLAFIFVSLTNLTLSGVPKEEMGNASGIYNLLRNLGGSFGVAFVTTVLARRAQFHQARLVENATPLDSNFQHAAAQIAQLPQAQGASPQAVNGVLFQKLMAQASLFSFADAFHLCTVILICIMPLVLFLRRPAHMRESVAAH
jgi:MFS transporter, DHA2 family, multidrug resistance protein